jgi:hypothetical protein
MCETNPILRSLKCQVEAGRPGWRLRRGPIVQATQMSFDNRSVSSLWASATWHASVLSVRCTTIAFARAMITGVVRQNSVGWSWGPGGEMCETSPPGLCRRPSAARPRSAPGN